MWKAEVYDTDMECWTDWDEIQPNKDKLAVLSDAKHAANKCAYRVRWRVVKT